MLSEDENNKRLIATAGGIAPLITLLSTGNAATQQSAAQSIDLLASTNTDNQLALVQVLPF